MKTHADKTQGNKNQSVVNASSQKSSGEFTFQFVDNRPEAVAQRKLQEFSVNNPQSMQLNAFQDTTNKNTKRDQADKLQILQLKSLVIQLMDKPRVTDKKLENIVNDLFKRRARFGDGSSMAACSYEVNNPDKPKIGGGDHIAKCEQYLNAVKKLLEKSENPRSPYNLSTDDWNAAVDLEDALNDALDGNYKG